jgi:hypothetical protein
VFAGSVSTAVSLTNLSTSTSSTTGALVVRGGVGIGGDLNVKGTAGNIVRKSSSLFGATNNNVVSLDTIRARVTTGDQPQLTSDYGIISVVWTTIETTSGTLNSDKTTGSLNSSAWTDVYVANPLSSLGDGVIVNLQDITNGIVYRINYLNSSPGGAYSIVIERLL